MADNRPIGIFDSGIGGLTVLREVIRELPLESTIYLGDNSRAPYGTKSHETIISYSLQDMHFLEEKNVKMIVVACNTASTHAYEVLKNKARVPVIEVVTPGAKAAVKSTKNGRIGIIATSATCNSGAYEAAVREEAKKLNKDSNLFIIQKACPLFVSLAEEGLWDSEITALACEMYLKEMKERQVDTLILACTHYPLLSKAISNYMGQNVKLINSGEAVASVVASKLHDINLISDDDSAIREFYTSDDPTHFEAIASPFLGSGLPSGTKKANLQLFEPSDGIS